VSRVEPNLDIPLMLHREAFKASPSLTQAQIDAAWNVFEYQYAQFDK
jgi:hypothetical protein